MSTPRPDAGSALPKPLDDVTVIEVDSWMAAPSAAAVLADMGATVIKVEPLTGDPMRGKSRPPKVDDPARSDYDFQFDVDNRGKRSIAMDLGSDDAIEVLHRLCADAQVFLCNLLPHRQERFRVDPASLLAVNESLVHATFTGYGTTGPEATRPGFDVTAFFGRSGLYSAMREGPDGVVPMARPAQGDHTAGLALVGAVLGALRLVDRTGQGQIVETSLYETAAWTLASDLAVTAVDRAPVRPRDRLHQILPTTNRFPCGDGKWIIIHMPTPGAWEPFCRAIGQEAWLDEARWADMKLRFRDMPAVVQAIDQALSERSRDEWGEIFDGLGIVWGPVFGFDEVVADPQAEARDMFPIVTSPQIGDYRTVRSPLRFLTADVGPQGPSPAVGEHTDQVLGAAGYRADQIAELRSSGAVG